MPCGHRRGMKSDDLGHAELHAAWSFSQEVGCPAVGDRDEMGGYAGSVVAAAWRCLLGATSPHRKLPGSVSPEVMSVAIALFGNEHVGESCVFSALRRGLITQRRDRPWRLSTRGVVGSTCTRGLSSPVC